MSANVHLVCRSHEPNLHDDNEFHRSSIAKARRQIANRQTLIAAWLELDQPSDVEGGFRRFAFLAAHLNCEIGIEDEDGRDRTEAIE